MRQRRYLQIPFGKFFFAFLFLFLCCLQTIIAGADEVDIIPFVTLSEEYNDNLFFSVNDEIDDFITIIGLGLEFVENTERLLASLSGRIDRVIYVDNDVLDDQGQQSPEDINERTFRTRLGLHYAYNEDLAFEVAYQYTFVRDRIDDTTANRNRIYGEIRWRWPLLD